MREPLWRNRREAFYYLLPVVVIAMLEITFAVAGPARTIPNWIDLAVSAGFLAGLVVRKRWPVTLMVASIVLSAIYVVAMAVGPDLGFKSDDPWISVTTPVIAYNVMVYGRSWWAAGLVALQSILAGRVWHPDTEVLLGATFMVVVPALIGLYISTHRDMVRALTDRAERAEREQTLLAEQARTDERVRLAEEMHDVVTHRVSLMVLHAGALGMTARDDETRTSAEGIRAAGCEALNELRELVGVLREGDGDRPDVKQPNSESRPVEVPDLTVLLSESASVGVNVVFSEQGNRALTSAAVSRTAYRIVQESLTNIRKHAPGSEATVRVRYGGDRIRVTIRNTTPTRVVDDGLSSSGSGSGLSGLRHRVELVGGKMTAGSRPDGGFEVDAILPAYVPTVESS